MTGHCQDVAQVLLQCDALSTIQILAFDCLGVPVDRLPGFFNPDRCRLGRLEVPRRLFSASCILQGFHEGFILMSSIQYRTVTQQDTWARLVFQSCHYLIPVGNGYY